jgi:hypothetical protein
VQPHGARHRRIRHADDAPKAAMSRSLGRTLAEGLEDFRADPVVALVKALALRPRSHASPMTTSMTSALRAAPINSASNAPPRSSDTDAGSVDRRGGGRGRASRIGPMPASPLMVQIRT